MKLSKCIILLALIATGLAAEDFWVFFEDKGPYSNQELLRMARSDLSQRSLDRRRAIGKEPGYAEAPIYEPYVQELEQAGCKVLSRARWINAVCVSSDDRQFISGLDFVEQISSSKTYTRPKPEQGESFKVSDVPDSLYGLSFAQLAMMDIDKMHDMGYTGAGVLIVTIDSGADITHPSLATTDIIATYDFINDTTYTGNAPGEDADQFHHGTKVLTEIGGYLPGVFIGAAYGATYAVAKTENVAYELQTEEYNWVEAVHWADSLGADIITSSLGYTDFDDGTGYTFDSLDGNSAVTTRIADYAASIGILVVNSAGNERQPYGWGYISPPADGDSVLAVGAQNSYGLYAPFSSPGPTADGRIKPDLATLGYGVRIPDPSDTTGTYLVPSNGTSFAAPLIAASAALVMEAREGSVRGWEVAELLMDAADQSCHPNNDYGYGRPYVPVAAGLESGVFVSLIDSSGSPVISNEINVTGPDSTWTIATDVRGVSSIRGLSSAEYSLEINVAGFPPRSLSFTGDESHCFLVDMSTGSAPFPDDDPFLVFPVPARDEITVSRRDFAERENMTIFLYDASGTAVLETKKELSGGVPGARFDLRNGNGEAFASGVYLLHIISSTTTGNVNKEFSKKIMVIN